MKKQLRINFILFFSFYLGHAQLFEGFENTTGPDPLPSTNWTLGSGNWFVFDNGIGPTRWTINSTIATPPLVNSGINAAYMNRDQTGGAGLTSEDYLATPLINFPLNGKLRFSSRTFTAGNTGTIYQIKICPGNSSPTNPANYTTTIAEFTEDQLSSDFDTYQERIINLPPTFPFGTTGYIAFVRKNIQQSSTIDGDRWLLDDVSIYQGCAVPSSLSTQTITQNSALLTWTGTPTATQWEIELLPAATTPSGSGITYSGSSPYLATMTSTGSPLTQAPLVPGTAYKYYIRAVCAGNNLSEWIGPYNFTTMIAPPGCGGTFTDAGGPNANYPNNVNAANGTVVLCPTNPGEVVTVTFTSFSTQANADYLKIYNGTNSAGPLLGSFSGGALPPAFTSSTVDGCLTFVFTSNATTSAPGWVANVTCGPPPPCPTPYNLVAHSITSSSATVHWTSPGPAATWHYIVLPQGAPAPTSAILGTPAPTNPFLITGLNSGTCYSVYVKGDCTSSSNGLSAWSNIVNFCTQVGPPVCGSNFVDQGGPAGNYPNNSNNVVTICPTVPGEMVSVYFSNFNVEATYDVLYVFNGNATSSPQIMSQNGPANYPGSLAGGYWGNIIPGPFTSTDATGCLTFQFRSDSGGTSTGWNANVICGSSDRIILTAFLDFNNNTIRDINENIFNYGSFVYQINNSGPNSYITSNNGAHVIFDSNPSNSYDFSYAVNPELSAYFSSAANFSNILITPGSGTQHLYFPITVLNPLSDVSLHILSSSPVPGFNNSYYNKIIYKNTGLTPTSGIITFDKDPAVTISSISQSGTTPTATGFTYNFGNLNPNETRSIMVQMAVPAIPTVNLGDIITNTASVFAAGDINPGNNYATNSRVVVGSYDPNDKTESHGPQIQYNQFTVNDYLYYTINFQNEGTADALNIRIEDVLHAKIDEGSIQMIDASHPYTMLRSTSNITWNFENIHLVPQSVSEELSKGYVIFKVKLKPGFAVGDVIPNTAQIYFDTNPVIITNTFNTQFVALNNADFDSSDFIISPNPATNNVDIQLQNTSETIDTISIIDVLGKTIRSLTTISDNQVQIDVSDFSKGIYFIEITTSSNLKQVKKLVIE